MAIRARENLVGAWAFLIGVVLATVGGIILSFGYSVNPIILALLAILGLVAGFAVSVDDNVGTKFLLVAVSLVIVSFAGQQGIASVSFGAIQIGQIVSATLAGLLALLVPATMVVAIKTLFNLAQR
ncbi:MAG: hypothetical protein AABX53_04360 [Nanoarchaeota archaeon]